MATGTRIGIGAAVVLGVTAYMAYVGASSSWQYYLTVDECIDDASRLVNNRIRVSGTIVPKSLRITQDRGHATFLMKGTNSDLHVTCSGLLPDNLAEDRQVVVEGQVNDAGLLVGNKVFTRCASKYSSQNCTVSGNAPDRCRPRGSE